MDEAGTLAGDLRLSGGRTQSQPNCIFNRSNVANLSCYTGSAMSEIPGDVEYRGHRIVWDARQIEGTSFWTGRAAVVSPANVSGVKSVYKIRVNAYFASEKEVRDHFVGVAKDRIDNGFENITSSALAPVF